MPDVELRCDRDWPIETGQLLVGGFKGVLSQEGNTSIYTLAVKEIEGEDAARALFDRVLGGLTRMIVQRSRPFRFDATLSECEPDPRGRQAAESMFGRASDQDYVRAVNFSTGILRRSGTVMFRSHGELGVVHPQLMIQQFEDALASPYDLAPSAALDAPDLLLAAQLLSVSYLIGELEATLFVLSSALEALAPRSAPESPAVVRAVDVALAAIEDYGASDSELAQHAQRLRSRLAALKKKSHTSLLRDTVSRVYQDDPSRAKGIRDAYSVRGDLTHGENVSRADLQEAVACLRTAIPETIASLSGSSAVPSE